MFDYYVALQSKDKRFDGSFFYGVKTTGIYCRPVCPAKPKKENVEIFQSPAEAEKSGYLPCKRCMPENFPQFTAHQTLNSILSYIEKYLFGNEQQLDVKTLSETFSLSERQIRRIFREHLGKSPNDFIADLRLNFARNMIFHTEFTITDIAMKSSFASIRSFNEAFKKRFRQAPSEVRRSRVLAKRSSNELLFKLPYSGEYNWSQVINYLKFHEVKETESISEDLFERFECKNGVIKKFEVNYSPHEKCLKVKLIDYQIFEIYPTLQKIKDLFDVQSSDLNIFSFFQQKIKDPDFLKYYRGIKVPGSFSAFETSIGIILGQLVSAKRAKDLMTELITNYGSLSKTIDDRSVYEFPSPATLAGSDLLKVRTTKIRRRCLQEFSQAVFEKTIDFEEVGAVDQTRKKLLSIYGIGEWTADYILMRCFRNPDVILKKDLIIAKILKSEEMNESFVKRLSPWRSYLNQYLWYRNKLIKEEQKDEVL